MIDTIVLCVPVTSEDIGNKRIFNPSAEKAFQFPFDMGFRKYVRNPSASEKKSGTYFPVLTLYKRMRGFVETDLWIQFSIPKLLFRNNFQEVSEYDFDNVLDALVYKLRRLDIRISREMLINAKIVTIHFSKNILLSKGVNCSMIQNQLYKAIDANQQLDFSQVIFKNGGQTLHIHSNQYEMAMYDKVKELEQAKVSQKRSIDPQGYIQLSLLEEITNTGNYFRLELRLNSKKAIKEKIGKYANKFADLPLTFKGLYSKALAQAMLSAYWNKEIRQRYINTTWKGKDSYEKLIETRVNNPRLSDTDLIIYSSLNDMIAQRGVATVRSTFGWIGKASYKWARIKKKLNELKVSGSKLYLIEDIDKQLNEFKLFRSIPKELKSLEVFKKK